MSRFRPGAQGLESRPWEPCPVALDTAWDVAGTEEIPLSKSSLLLKRTESPAPWILGWAQGLGTSGDPVFPRRGRGEIAFPV